MRFAIYRLDNDNSPNLRPGTRERHLAGNDDAPVRIVPAGPLLSADPTTMRRSSCIVEADDIAATGRFSANDPYRGGVLFGRVQVRGFRQVVPR